MPSFTWLDDETEHSDADDARATALASRWTELIHAEEQRQFSRQSDIEDGRYDGPEPDECETCCGSGLVGLDDDVELATVRCTAEGCEGGYDMRHIRQMEKRQREAQAERDLEIELIEDELSAIGARMMRPYEHWNEDEAYMAYMERDRD